MRLRPFVLWLALAVCCAPALLFSGCSGTTGSTDGGDGDSGDGDGDGDGDTTCAAGGGTVCDIQNANSGNNIPAGNKATLTGVIATTDIFTVSMNLQGFFVADSGGGFNSGVLVTVPTTANITVAAGDTIDVTGTVTEFSSDTSAGSETQLAVFPDDGDTVTVTGSGTPPAPLEVSDLDQLQQEAAEGTLVKVSDVFVSDPDVGGGNFKVQNGMAQELQIGDTIFRYTPLDAEVFGAITGVVRYNTFQTGTFELSPRSSDDVEGEEIMYDVGTIVRARNQDAADAIAECPFNDDCTTYIFEKVVVTSPTFVLDRDDDTNVPYLFGFFVADPLAVNGSGELDEYSGIMVAFIPGANAVRENDYTFGKTGDGDDYDDPTDSTTPADFPQIGDVVSVAGQNKPNFDQGSLQDVVVLRKDGTTDTLSDVTMPMPAQFDAATAGALKGGRPQGDASWPVQDFDEAPSADIEKWEGVLVQMNGVDTVSACYPSPFNPGGFNSDPADAFLSDFGYWTVSGDVEIGTLFVGYFDTWFGGYWGGLDFEDPMRNCDNLAAKCADSREVGQTFTSLTGVINFRFSVWRVNPRTNADITPSNLFVADNCQE